MNEDDQKQRLRLKEKRKKHVWQRYEFDGVFLAVMAVHQHIHSG